MAGSSDDIIVLRSGKSCHNAYVEEFAREILPCLDQIVVLDSRSEFLIALITLRPSEDLAGRLLGDDALALAKKCGSSANTLITARSCALFRAGDGLQQELCGAHPHACTHARARLHAGTALDLSMHQNTI